MWLVLVTSREGGYSGESGTKITDLHRTPPYRDICMRAILYYKVGCSQSLRLFQWMTFRKRFRIRNRSEPECDSVTE